MEQTMATNNKKADNANIQNYEPMKPEYGVYVDGAIVILPFLTTAKNRISVV